LQIIILIEFAYVWNEKWTDDANPRYKTVAACFTILYAASIVICVYLFSWFASDANDCKLERFFIGFTIALTATVTLISITKWCQHGALLPSGVVTLYCFYLCYSALTSDTSSCNSLQTETTPQVVIGIAIAAVTVCYAGWNLSNSSTIFGVDKDEEKEHEVANVASSSAQGDAENPKKASDESASAAADEDKEEDNSGPETEVQMEKRKRDLKFHLVMATCSMYLAMLLTSWGSSTESSGTSYDLSDTAMWIKIVTQWVCILLYAWTLLAPYVLQDRDFS